LRSRTGGFYSRSEARRASREPIFSAGPHRASAGLGLAKESDVMTGRHGTWLTGLVLALALSAAAPPVASATFYTLHFTPASLPSGSRATISAEF
jgi:hypothetical protein